MDAGTVERWIDPGYQKVYERIFAGAWRGYDPFDATHRLQTREIPSPAVCSMFRTFQGWTALTRQGPKDGTLRLIPLAEGIAYVLLRAVQDDVDEADLCGAAPGRALGVSPEWHPELIPALVSIPEVMPGRHCLLAYGHLPCGRRRAYRSGVRERHLHRICSRLSEEPRLPSQTARGVPGRPFRSRLCPDGLRNRLHRTRDSRGSDPSRSGSDGLLARLAGPGPKAVPKEPAHRRCAQRGTKRRVQPRRC